MTDLELGMVAYQAYGDAAKWKNFRGGEMPIWNKLPEEIKTYWEASVVAVKTSLFQWKRDDDESRY